MSDVERLTFLVLPIEVHFVIGHKTRASFLIRTPAKMVFVNNYQVLV